MHYFIYRVLCAHFEPYGVYISTQWVKVVLAPKHILEASTFFPSRKSTLTNFCTRLCTNHGVGTLNIKHYFEGPRIKINSIQMKSLMIGSTIYMYWAKPIFCRGPQILFLNSMNNSDYLCPTP